MSSSNHFNQGSRFLASKPRNEVDAKEEIFRIEDISLKHYLEFSEMKTSDVSNVAWCTAADQSLWWIGGFRPSKLLQVIVPQLQHSCSQQQLSDICNLVQSCEQVEYALARGMEKLHQILHNATTEGERGLKLTSAPQQMRFLKQANDVRQEFLHRLCGLLTNSQYAEFLLCLGECLYNPSSSL
ncbi:TGACG-sequence-specific DNA-binding protein TGA-1A isoform X2 [Vigna radiata var. radiata]|uniref:TGACG-sequence-specific DNA-binding protein TGA-1A isoform X2 n=1 Tax=Vigna radiata var. radiata TaxID=3916 RepID=A0A3Q0FFE4_VIGRR|nr:TGACG-sequence-specific DNA-binding protein TGA-1A isoform X2 [Vigna radiata var. radiata]